MKDCLKNTFRPESGGPDPIPGGWEDTLVKGTVSFDELGKTSIKKNVFFRALPESPKPPPHDPNSGNLVLFFWKSKFKI